jgi:hypothetical protein
MTDRKVSAMRPSASRALAATLGAGLVAVLVAAGTTGIARAGDAATRTHRVVLRPVDAAGDPAAGWTVTREHDITVQCDGAASAAVDDGITACYPTAAYLPACWKSDNHTVLCLRDARKEKLVRVRYTGSFGAPVAPKHPSPQDLVLTGGQQCDIRFGGAWGQLPSHPSWVGFYSCSTGSVYGPASGDGINRSAPLWTVHLWKGGTKEHVVTRSIGKAYYVGTAA